jgi:hypothetical protein
MPYIIGILSVFTILNLKDDIPGRQWWSKRFDLTIALLLLISCALVIAGKINPVVIPLLLYSSLLGGILQSFFIKFC